MQQYSINVVTSMSDVNNNDVILNEQLDNDVITDEEVLLTAKNNDVSENKVEISYSENTCVKLVPVIYARRTLTSILSKSIFRATKIMEISSSICC